MANQTFWDAAPRTNTQIDGTERFGVSIDGADFSVSMDQLFGPDVKYRIYEEDGTVFVRDPQTGGAVFSSADASTAIQYAMSNLTPGRTSNDIILIFGDYVLSETLDVDSYTTIVLNGTMTASPTFIQNNGMIRNSDVAGGNTSIRFQGGIYDGNRDNHATALITFGTLRFNNVTDLKLTDVTVRNSRVHQIYMEDVDNFTVQGCFLDAQGDDGVAMTASSFGNVTGNVMQGGDCSIGGSHGVEMERGSHDIVVTNNIVRNYTTAGDTSNTRQCGGILVTDEAGALDTFCYRVIISSNQITDVNRDATFGNSSKGIGLICDNVNNFTTDIVVTGNILKDSGRNPIECLRVKRFVISNNIVDGADPLAGTFGFSITGCENGSITANTMKDAGRQGVYIQGGCKYIVIDGNTIYNWNVDDVANNWGIHSPSSGGANERLTIVNNMLVDDSGRGNSNGIQVVETTGGHVVANNSVSIEIAKTDYSLSFGGVIYAQGNVTTEGALEATIP